MSRRLGILGVAAVLAAGLGLVEASPAAAAVSYYLPYATGTTASLNQGPGDCNPTHCPGGSLEHAYDFGLSGGEVWASAPGTLVARVTTVTGQTGPGSWGSQSLPDRIGRSPPMAKSP